MSASESYPDFFAHFKPLDEAQDGIAQAVLEQVRSRMTDSAFAELVKAGIVQATQDKESAARIVAGALTVARLAKGLLGIGL